MTTRRRFLQIATATGAGAYLGSKLSFWREVGAQAAGRLSPYVIPKFVTPLVIPPAMPVSDRTATADHYEIAMRQFTQQILPAPFGRTPVWGYGSLADPRTFNAPSCTIEATADRLVTVKWINQLVDESGAFLPHLFPVDQTLHWANPPGGIAGRDKEGEGRKRYVGPVPISPHLHGAHTTDDSDGYPAAWFLPAATNIPASYAQTGTWYNLFREKYLAQWGVDWEPGSATFAYPNDQRAATLWYHDHTLGVTRVNVYAGPAGFYLIRGGAEDLPPGFLPGPAPAVDDPSETPYYEIPIAIQDRMFNADATLFYPGSRAFFEGVQNSQLHVPFIGEPACGGPSDISPIWNPEFFGNAMVVNGRTWPFLEVEQRRYRFRLLNGCNSRFLILKMSIDGLPFWQIGNDGGFLDTPVELERVLLAPAERADVIVDFTHLPLGTEIVLLNLGPDEMFRGGTPGVDFRPADPGSTGRVMQLRVVSPRSIDASIPPAALMLPPRTPLPVAGVMRGVALFSPSSSTVRVKGGPPPMNRPKGKTVPIWLSCETTARRLQARFLLGPSPALFSGTPLHFGDPITENPALGSTEVWEIRNLTGEAHPIHIHQVQFEVVNRETRTGQVRAAEAWEQGVKDTVIVYPLETTRVKAMFNRPGQFVWHCHMLEHEDNDMMRPYSVGPLQTPL